VGEASTADFLKSLGVNVATPVEPPSAYKGQLINRGWSVSLAIVDWPPRPGEGGLQQGSSFLVPMAESMGLVMQCLLYMSLPCHWSCLPLLGTGLG
jgi:hypothetical protein